MSKGKTTKVTIGKREYIVTGVNEPSEEAIMRCRKVVSKIMRRIMSEEKNKEFSLVNRKDNV